MTPETIETRVARGAQLLDRELPGWARRISLGRLQLASGTDCVLGQLFCDEHTLTEAERALAARDVVETDAGENDRRWTPRYLDRTHGCAANFTAGAIVLGRVLRDKGLEGGLDELMVSHGFNSAVNDATHRYGLAGERVEYRELDEAWAQEVRDRQ